MDAPRTEAVIVATLPAPAPTRARDSTLWLFAAVAVLFAALSVRYAHKAGEDRSAFNRWRGQLLHLREGVDLAARFNYPNPPVMAVLLEPFALLPPVAGALAWYAVKAAMALVVFAWAFRLVEPPGRPLPLWAKGLIVAASLKPVLDDLSHGNVNLLILFLVVASLEAYRRGRDLLAGGVLALAVACKVTPLLLVGYFAWKRSWRALAGVAAGTVLFLYPGVVPALRLGMDHNQRQLASWYGVMVRPFVVEGKVTSEHINQSLPGAAFRLLSRSPSFVDWRDDVEVPVRYDNVAELSVAQVKWLVKGAMGLFVVLVVWTCRTPTAPRDNPALAAEYGVIVIGMLLFSERTWKHHAVTLVVPIAVLAGAIAFAATLGRRAGVAGALGLALLLMLLPGLGAGQDRLEAGLAPSFAKLALSYGAYTAAFLVLLAGQVWALRGGLGGGAGRASRRAAPDTDEPCRSPAAAA
jgi:alpha-1,2-mannosyltransferase